ncbi:hypothetical protein ACFL5K_02630 [Gemmatimonadota bacterium]
MRYRLQKFLLLPVILCTFFSPAARAAAQVVNIQLTAHEFEGLARRNEPITTGVNLPRGAVKSTDELCIFDSNGSAVSCQFETTATWPDGSIKWVLADFFASCAPNAKATFFLRNSKAGTGSAPQLKINSKEDGMIVETGILKCSLSKNNFDLFESIYLDHNKDGRFSDDELVSAPEASPAVYLLDDRGRDISSRWGEVTSIETEAEGPVRVTVAVKGSLGDRDGERRLDYTARISFYNGTGFVRVQFTLQNFRPAGAVTDEDNDLHWLLGQSGGYYFEEMSLNSRLKFEGPIVCSVGDREGDILDRITLTSKTGIYQESSGGENWYGRVHMNHNGEVPLTFRGAKAFAGAVSPYQRNRPDAWLHVADRRYGLAVAVKYFWQNFPKALSAEPDGTVRVALWPSEFSDSHEIQGGEIKTHEVAFYFHTGAQGSRPSENHVATLMNGFHKPLFVRAPAEHYLADGFFDEAVPYNPKRFPTYENLMQSGVIAEPLNLLYQIEERDEYGWRNFGDTPAYNEYDESGGPHTGRLAVSHFNHEYDHGYGMLFQSLRTISADPGLSYKWWYLADSGLRHESDIDFYHCFTDDLRGGVFNGGKFAHSAHGVEVATGTHRSGAPLPIWWGVRNWRWGRGGSPESGHFNSRGLVAHYLLTGNRRLLETHREITNLVEFKINENKFAQISQVNRDCGNTIQILTDAYLLTWDEKYVTLIEKAMEASGPDKQWWMSEEGRKTNSDKILEGYWQPSQAIDAVARWTRIMETNTGKPYQKGRDYVVRYADFASRFLAGGPDTGFYSSWNPVSGGKGNLSIWSMRTIDVMMYGHRYSKNSVQKARMLKAARDSWTFMQRKFPGKKPVYHDSKFHTILAGGGHSYTYYNQHGKWPGLPLAD